MSECIVLGARRIAIHASKTISKGKRPPPQTRQEQGLGRTVVGGPTEEVQGTGPLYHEGEKRSRSGHGCDPQAAKRGCRPNSRAPVYLRCLPRTGIPADVPPEDVPPEMEGVHSNDD